MKKLLVILIVLLTGCSIGYSSIINTSGHLETINRVEALNPDISSKLNNFGISLYNQIYEENKNIFISPASIYLLLGMIYNGANNNTKSEMAKVLNADDLSLDVFNKLSRDLQSLILGYKDSKFELANSIWLRDTYEEYVKKDFINRNKDYYGAMVSSLDFNKSSSIDTINDWVKKNTKGRIEKAIDENKIDPSTVMYLINTIYFKADWKEPFKKENTSYKHFTNSNQTLSVEMMSKADNLGYVENETLQGVLLPYSDNKTAMFIILPKGDNKVALDSGTLVNLINTMKKNVKQVQLNMPKVKIEYGIKLNDSLSNLGMKDAFLSNADFSNMALNAVKDGLHISSITHKTYLSIDEKGTEAAAMTKGEIGLTAIPSPSIVMNVDHPYIVGIVDKESNAILFIGRIFDPIK